MANNETMRDVKLNTALMEAGVKNAKTALLGLDKVLASISQRLEDAFTVKGFKDYQQTVSRFGKRLADDLLVLQLNFGKLKWAIADAAAPIVERLVPWLEAAVRKATQFAQTATGVIRVVLGNEAVADSAEAAAKAEEKLASAGKAASRTLMSIDQLQRLNQSTGGGSAASEEYDPYIPAKITDRAREIAEKILQILAPLRAIDFTNLQGALEQLRAGFSAVGAVAADALRYLWYQVMTPFFAWVAEEFAPAFTTAWAAAMNTAAAALQPVTDGAKALFAALRPVIAFIGESVVLALGQFRGAFERLGVVFTGQGGQITGILANVGVVVTNLWNRVSPILELLRQRFFTTFSQVGQVVADVASGILQALYGVSEYLAGAFTGDWKQSWEGIRTFFAGLVNGLIGLLNVLLSRLGSALNSVISAANKLQFDLPDWVPGIGGSEFGLNMSPVSVPQIPYLARGAVLPANKPFLAMVGDQHSGTNVEAPLATIQQAVRLELGEMVSSMMAGFEASVGVQKEILEAVLGITIGDEVIGAAAQRYNHRQAVIRGGAV